MNIQEQEQIEHEMSRDHITERFGGSAEHGDPSENVSDGYERSPFRIINCGSCHVGAEIDGRGYVSELARIGWSFDPMVGHMCARCAS